METPAAAAPLQLPFEPSQQFISGIDAVNPMVSPYSMESSRSLFRYILTEELSPPDSVNDQGSSSMSGSAFMTNTTASNYDGIHDLQEAAETTTTNSSAIYGLWEIAKEMKSNGHVSECIQVYKTSRKAFLRTSLLSCGVETLSTKNMQRLLSNELEEWMDGCIKACNASCSILFPLEMTLCAEIFESDERDACYLETIEDSLGQLIAYADSLISARRFPGLLFKHLDLYSALVNVWSLPGVLRTEHSDASIDKLAEKIRHILSDSEKSVIHELSTSTTPKAGGEIVALTNYVTHYLTRVAEYKSVLTDLIVSKPPYANTGVSNKIMDVEYAQIAGRTPLELHVAYIVVLLRFKLESKCKYYYKADSAESFQFLANNLAHIVRCIAESPKLESMIGTSYVNKLREDYLKQAMRNYQRKTCDNMLRYLRKNSAGRCFPEVQSSSIDTLKRKITSFYTMFEEARLNQARWVALVNELRLGEEQSVPIVEELVVAYTTFLERFSKGVASFA